MKKLIFLITLIFLTSCDNHDEYIYSKLSFIETSIDHHIIADGYKDSLVVEITKVDPEISSIISVGDLFVFIRGDQRYRSWTDKEVRINYSDEIIIDNRVSYYKMIK